MVLYSGDVCGALVTPLGVMTPDGCIVTKAARFRDVERHNDINDFVESNSYIISALLLKWTDFHPSMDK